MVLFNWLLIGHLVGDFILQTRWMAEKPKLLPLVVHSLVYTAAVTAMSLFDGGLAPWAVAVIFLSHVLIDQRKFIDFWAEKITGTEDIQWLKVVLDQSWHILILGLVTLI